MTEVEAAPDATHCYRHPDRETLVSCSRCERPICPSCMIAAPVGMQCPECAGTASRNPVRRRGGGGAAALRGPSGTMTATTVLLVVNVVVFLAEMFQGVTVSGISGSTIIAEGGVRAFEVANGEWWRIVTAGFIHAGLFHILFNMWALWVLGGAIEEYAGTGRMLVIYSASVLWGSAGALLLSPDALTVGASGGVFGLMGALLVMSRQQGMSIMQSPVGMLLLINLVITFAIPGISIGGHLGGLVGGIAAALVISNFGRGHIAYGRVTPPVVIGCAAVLAGAVAVALWAANAAV